MTESAPGLNLLRATSSSRLAHRAAALVDGMARHGTTSLEAKSGIALDRTGELKMLRAAASVAGKPLDIVSTYFGARAVAPEFHGDPERYLAWICSDVLPLIRRRKLASFVEVSCEQGRLQHRSGAALSPTRAPIALRTQSACRSGVPNGRRAPRGWRWTRGPLSI